MSKEQTRQRVLEALLNSNTLTEAAQKAGISRKTLYSYLRSDKELAQVFQDAQNTITFALIEEAALDRERAKATIIAIMEDTEQPAAIRLKAAQTILESYTAQQDKAERIIGNNINLINANGIFGDIF